MSISLGNFTWSSWERGKLLPLWKQRWWDMNYRCPTLPSTESLPENEANSVLPFMALFLPTPEATSVTAVGTIRGAPAGGHSGCWYCLYSRGQCYPSPLPGFLTFWPTSHNLSNLLNIILLLSDFCVLGLCHNLPVPSSRPRKYTWAVSLELSQSRFNSFWWRVMQGDKVSAQRA